MVILLYFGLEQQLAGVEAGLPYLHNLKHKNWVKCPGY